MARDHLTALAWAVLIAVAAWPPRRRLVRPMEAGREAGTAVQWVTHAQQVLLGVLTAGFALLPLGVWVAFAVAALVLQASGGSILGGLGTFGLVGLFLGPVVMAAVLTVWRSRP